MLYITYCNIAVHECASRDERSPAKGPHGLTREQVQASQRQRLLDAALDVVGEYGYAAATVADITTAAGVSRTTFYEQFRNKMDAFLTAYGEFGRTFLADIADTPATTPVDTLTAAGERLVDWGRRRPLACRAFLLEIQAVGEEGLERRDRMMSLAVERYERVAAWVRTLDPTLPLPPRSGRPRHRRGVVGDHLPSRQDPRRHGRRYARGPGIRLAARADRPPPAPDPTLATRRS